MKIEILEDRENPLFKRKLVKLIVESKITPSKIESMKIISDKFKVDESKIVIDKVQGKFGRNTFLVEAKIYNSLEDKETIEPKVKEKKKG